MDVTKIVQNDLKGAVIDDLNSFSIGMFECKFVGVDTMQQRLAIAYC